MGLFDFFKKNKKEDDLDKQIAELQAKNAAAMAQNGGASEDAKAAEDMMKAFVADTMAGKPVSDEETLKAAADFDALAGQLGVKTDMSKKAEKKVSGEAFSAKDIMDNAREFDGLAAKLGVKVNMSGMAAGAADFETPDCMVAKAGVGHRESDGMYFVYGSDENYAPVYYCVDTEKYYAPGWVSIIDYVFDNEMLETRGEYSEGEPAVMNVKAGTGGIPSKGYSFVYGVAQNYSPIIYCIELKKYINVSWDEIGVLAIDSEIDKTQYDE